MSLPTPAEILADLPKSGLRPTRHMFYRPADSERGRPADQGCALGIVAAARFPELFESLRNGGHDYWTATAQALGVTPEDTRQFSFGFDQGMLGSGTLPYEADNPSFMAGYTCGVALAGVT